MTGTAGAASFCVTTTPKRDAICAMNRTRTGAPSASTPRSAMKRAASATDLASSPRAAKYPLSAAFASLSRVPRANTCRQARALSAIRKVLALAARDVSDRPQHDDGRDREFYRQRGETEAATHSPDAAARRYATGAMRL